MPRLIKRVRHVEPVTDGEFPGFLPATFDHTDTSLESIVSPFSICYLGRSLSQGPYPGFRRMVRGQVDNNPVLLQWIGMARKVSDGRRRLSASSLTFEEEFHLTVTAGGFTTLTLTAREAYQEAVKAACSTRRLFVTSKGSFGLDPPGVQVSDAVCVILGIQTPVIPREQPHLVRLNENVWPWR